MTLPGCLRPGWSSPLSPSRSARSPVARSYGVARSWIYALLARYEAEGEAAFEPRSRRPKRSPRAISDDTLARVPALPRLPPPLNRPIFWWY
jgi:hypothetical protein